MASETFEVSLQGGSPWGFRLQGGKEFRAPLLIAKVTAGSKASKEGILVGDLLISINNEPCDDMTHSNALNCIKKSGKNLTLTLARRPFDGNDVYSYKSLPRGTKLTNGDVSNNNNDEFKSVEGYATLPRRSRNKNSDRVNHDDNVEPGDERDGNNRPNSLDTRSSGFSSKYSEEDDDLLARAYGVMSPSNEEWSPDLISDAVRTPQPIRLLSNNEPVPSQYLQKEPTRVKSPTTIHGFTDKPSPVGRGARRNNDEENRDSTDNELLTSGSANNENIPEDDDSAAEQPYRRYSYHGSVLRDSEPKPDTPERPRIQAGSGWYKELFKEMHTGAGNSTGLSSLLAGDVSPPPKNDARGLFKGYRERATSAQEAGLRATKTQETHAEPSSSGRYTRPETNIETKQSYRHSTSSIPSATATVQMREKPTTRSNVPSWYRELQKGNEVSEEEINEDRKQPSRNYQAPGTSRPPGDIGPEYPVVRSFSLGTRPASGPVVHREPPKKMHTQNFQQRNDVAMPANRYPAATRGERIPVQKEPERPSATNLYEDHMRNRQFSPRPQRKETYEPVDYIKQFEEEEQKIKEDELRAKEELERKLREEEKAKEEAEQRRREAELKKKQEIEARKNPKHARALYNFTPQSSKEIGFRKGDIVLFYRPIDTNWCEGEAQGQIGLYPISYVEILEENILRTEGEGKVKYNFKAESTRELDLQKGDIVGIIRQIDKNWYEGIKDEKIGIFPVSYIELLREPGESENQGSPKQVEEQVIAKQNGLPEVESAADDFFPDPPQTQEPDINSLDGEKFTVVFTYSPQNEDELELLEGDIVKVVEKCDDGWYVGVSERTGEFGTFPGNYVKHMS